MESWPTRILPTLLALAMAACATAAPAPERGAHEQRDVLDESQLQGMERLNTYQAIRRLRPRWLSTRGQLALVGTQREGVRVYVDGMLHGEAQSLRAVPVNVVGELRFLAAPQATLRFGTGHSSGAILVSIRRGLPGPGSP